MQRCRFCFTDGRRGNNLFMGSEYQSFCFGGITGNSQPDSNYDIYCNRNSSRMQQYCNCYRNSKSVANDQRWSGSSYLCR